MIGDSGQQLTCNLGVTGKLLRRALATRSAPPVFREALRRQLIDQSPPPSEAGAAQLPGGARFQPGGSAVGHRL